MCVCVRERERERKREREREREKGKDTLFKTLIQEVTYQSTSACAVLRTLWPIYFAQIFPFYVLTRVP